MYRAAEEGAERGATCLREAPEPVLYVRPGRFLRETSPIL